MRFENVCDGKFLLARHLEININIGPRIENRSDAFVIVAKQIRKFCDALRLDRFENERHSPELTRSRAEVQQDRQLQFCLDQRREAGGSATPPGDAK
jgi:hypothetical protein